MLKTIEKPNIPEEELIFILNLRKSGKSVREINIALIEYRFEMYGRRNKNLTCTVDKIVADTENGVNERKYRWGKIHEYNSYLEQKNVDK